MDTDGCHSHHFILGWGRRLSLQSLVHVAADSNTVWCNRSGLERATCGANDFGQIYTMCNKISKVDCIGER